MGVLYSEREREIYIAASERVCENEVYMYVYYGCGNAQARAAGTGGRACGAFVGARLTGSLSLAAVRSAARAALCCDREGGREREEKIPGACACCDESPRCMYPVRCKRAGSG